MGARLRHFPSTPGGGIAGGDLDVSGPLRITGAGTARTAVDGGRRGYRVFHIISSGGEGVAITALTIQNGNAGRDFNGGGVFNEGTARVLSAR